jgi:hypothetical protein
MSLQKLLWSITLTEPRVNEQLMKTPLKERCRKLQQVAYTVAKKKLLSDVLSF